MELGKTQKLEVKEFNKNGALLQDDKGNTVLLPNKETENLEIGQDVDAFIYNDSEDRPIATLKKPKIEIGEFVPLKVVDRTRVGAFLDWGLEKDLFLPFSEQITKVMQDRSYLVYLYIDRSGRLAASTKVYDELDLNSPYKKGDWVTGYVYNINPEVGAFVAVDNKYNGLIHKEDLNSTIHNGDTVKVRVVNVRPDGKLQLSPIKKAYKEVVPNSLKIVKALKENNGFIPFNDKTEPEFIRDEFDISKGAFKKALSYLLKNKVIEQTDLGIKLSNQWKTNQK